MTRPELTYDLAKRRYDYDGVMLTWSHRISADDHCNFFSMAGMPVGAPNGRGYWRTSYKGRTYFVHRIIWLWVYGEWPSGQIDHINRDPSDNRIDNLRDVTAIKNRWNRSPPEKEIPVPGIRNMGAGKYGAYIGCGENFKWLGTHDSKEGAICARQREEITQRGEFAADHISNLRRVQRDKEVRRRLPNDAEEKA